MAKEKLRFPMNGKNVNFAASTQPDFTSADLCNVRPFDVLEKGPGADKGRECGRCSISASETERRLLR